MERKGVNLPLKSSFKNLADIGDHKFLPVKEVTRFPTVLARKERKAFKLTRS